MMEDIIPAPSDKSATKHVASKNGYVLYGNVYLTRLDSTLKKKTYK